MYLYSTQKKCYAVQMLTSSRIQMSYLECRNYYTKIFEYGVIFWTLNLRILSYRLDTSLTDWKSNSLKLLLYNTYNNSTLAFKHYININHSLSYFPSAITYTPYRILHLRQ